MCFLPCASRQGRPFWPPAGDHEGRPYGAFAPIRKDWEARMAYHILLVDDAPELRRMVGELLEGAGYQPIRAGTCALALTLYASHRPDLALLDLGLPDADGMRFLREVRRENRTPVIVLSARSNERDKVEALDAGEEPRVVWNVLCDQMEVPDSKRWGHDHNAPPMPAV